MAVGRNRKLTKETLMGIIRSYIENTSFITKIKYTDLSSYATSIGIENVLAQDFRRNLEVKEFVEKFNDENKLTKELKFNNGENIGYIDLDVDSIVHTYRNDINTQKVLLNIFRDNYEALVSKITEIYDELNALKSISKEKEENLRLLEIENKELKKQIKHVKQSSREQEILSKEQRAFNQVLYLKDKNVINNLNIQELESLIRNIFGVAKKDSDILNETNVPPIVPISKKSTDKNVNLVITDKKNNAEESAELPNIFG